MAKNYSLETMLQAIEGSGGITLTVATRLQCDWITAKRYIQKWETTRMAFEALPGWERTLWKEERERFVSQYCLYPDLYWDAGRHEEVRPYALLIEGHQFHYTPANDADNDWEMAREGESWVIRRAREGPTAQTWGRLPASAGFASWSTRPRRPWPAERAPWRSVTR